MPAVARRAMCLLLVFVGVLLVALPVEGQAQRNKRKRRGSAEETAAPAVAPATTPEPARAETPLIHFDTLVYDFGRVEQGDVVRYSFRFENTGGKPLTIERVKVSCGCTVPTYTDKPVRPAQVGSIDVAFNSAGKMGPQEKTIMVYTNTPEGVVVLTLVGEVQSQLLPERRGGQK